jgi:hypothetical protein
MEFPTGGETRKLTMDQTIVAQAMQNHESAGGLHDNHDLAIIAWQRHGVYAWQREQNCLVVCDECGQTKFPFSFVLLSGDELEWAVADFVLPKMGEQARANPEPDLSRT